MDLALSTAEAVTERRVLSLLRKETFAELFDRLLDLCKLCLRPVLIPQSASRLYAVLRRLVGFVGEQFEDGGEIKDNFVVFASAMVKLDDKSDYERIPDDLQADMVDLIGEMANSDPDGNWCKWDGRIHNMCGKGTYVYVRSQ